MMDKNICYYIVLLGMKRVFKQQDLQILFAF